MNKSWILKEILPRVLLLKTQTQAELASIFIRPSEFIESPFKEIRNHTFTLGYLKSLYSLGTGAKQARHSGGFTYIGRPPFFEGDWNGFNIPSTAFAPFIQGLFDPLTPEELALLELIRYRTDDYCIIGIHLEKGEDYAITHEVAHALYYTNSEYKKEVLSFLTSRSPKLLKSCGDFIEYLGYSPEVTLDETHAYFGVDGEYLIRHSDQYPWSKFDINAAQIRELSSGLVAIFNKYYKESLNEI